MELLKRSGAFRETQFHLTRKINTKPKTVFQFEFQCAEPETVQKGHKS